MSRQERRERATRMLGALGRAAAIAANLWRRDVMSGRREPGEVEADVAAMAEGLRILREVSAEPLRNGDEEGGR